MSRRSITSDCRSRFGLPKNVVFTERRVDLPPGAEAWLQARDDFDAMLLDTLDALQSRLIDRSTFDREKSRLMVARRKADGRYEHALRTALRPKPPGRRY